MASNSAPEKAVVIEHEHEHDRGCGRFLARVDDVEARLDYRVEGDRMVITHISVPESITGQGIAGRLTRAAFEHARAESWKVQPACPYAAGWSDRHPQYRSLLA